ncbi:MAG: DNA gyrase subunit A [Jatrophihabitantaceae bacterium]
MSDDDVWNRQHREEALRQRLEILDALVAALERRTEVFDVIAASVSADAARERLSEMLGVSEIGATAVLDLQSRRFAQIEAQRIADERDQLRHQLGL